VANKDISSLDAFLVSTTDNKNPIRITVEYEEANEVGQLGGSEVEPGWNFVGVTQNGPASTALSSTTGKVGEVVHLYSGPIDSPGTAASPAFAVGPNDASTDLNPHAGYWIYMNEGGEIASVVPAGTTAGDMDSLLKWSD